MNVKSRPDDGGWIVDGQRIPEVAVFPVPRPFLVPERDAALPIVEGIYASNASTGRSSRISTNRVSRAPSVYGS